MNLHSVVNKAPGWVWYRLYGRATYVPIGTHLWLVERGTPPDAPTEGYSYRMRYNTPERFRWFPYMVHNPTPAALCGFRTRASEPRREWAGDAPSSRCYNCVAQASERGIINKRLEEIMRTDPEYLAIQEEWNTWRQQY